LVTLIAPLAYASSVRLDYAVAAPALPGFPLLGQEGFRISATGWSITITDASPPRRAVDTVPESVIWMPLRAQPTCHPIRICRIECVAPRACIYAILCTDRPTAVPLLRSVAVQNCRDATGVGKCPRPTRTPAESGPYLHAPGYLGASARPAVTFRSPNLRTLTTVKSTASPRQPCQKPESPDSPGRFRQLDPVRLGQSIRRRCRPIMVRCHY
jgi:hypothetical protein